MYEYSYARPTIFIKVFLLSGENFESKTVAVGVSFRGCAISMNRCVLCIIVEILLRVHRGQRRAQIDVADRKCGFVLRLLLRVSVSNNNSSYLHCPYVIDRPLLFV